MYNTTTAFVSFADAVEEISGQLAPEDLSFIRSLALRHVGGLKRFPRPGDDLRGDLRRCFADGAFIVLAAVACICGLEIKFSVMVENSECGSPGRLLEVGELIARGDFGSLDDLVRELAPGGWNELGHHEGAAHTIRQVTRCRLAVAAETRASSDPTWLAAASSDVTGASGIEGSECEDVITSDAQPLVADDAQPEPVDQVVDVSQARLGGFQGCGILKTLATAMNSPLNKRRPVFGTMVERGTVTLLAAAPGIGKTTFGIQAACAVASGRAWAGFGVEGAGRVLYLNAEDPEEEVVRRFMAAKIENLLPPLASYGVHLVGRTEQRLMEKVGGRIAVTDYGIWLRDVAIELRPALIVIDPKVMTHSLDENSNAEMGALFGYFADLAAMGDAGVLVVHHTGKDQKEGLGAARGASSITASVRSIWHLGGGDKASPPEAVRLSCVKSNHHAIGQSRFFRRIPVTLPNGDDVGLLKQVGDEAVKSDR